MEWVLLAIGMTTVVVSLFVLFRWFEDQIHPWDES